MTISVVKVYDPHYRIHGLTATELDMLRMALNSASSRNQDVLQFALNLSDKINNALVANGDRSDT